MSGGFNLDPRVKLLLFCVTCCFVMGVTRPIPIICLGLFLTAVLCLSGKCLFAMKSFGIMSLAVACSVYIPNRISGVAGLLLLGICVLSRMMIPIVMAFTLVFQTTNTSQFMSALQRMKLPVKTIIPILIMFRFVPTVREEWNGIQKAMAFRGISLHPVYVIRHPIITMEHVLIPLLFSAASIIEELAAASLARGLDSNRERTCLIQTRMQGWDYVCMIITMGYAGIWLSGYMR
ncbi:energy-coupling factor transporter transmembrane component T [uncultured Robinsoniella sp.]|uniref:energy-coupling factor transporter transmembrane component T n=1 Tax=uncultured Robinsoniella sp. TaxID=904190 RepID=UPI00374F0B2E